VVKVIDVIGRGTVGFSLAERWREAGHDVAVLGRATPVRERADAVLLAVPARVVVHVADTRAAELEGRLVIDATNDITAATRDLGGAIQAAAPGALVAKAFNTVFATFYEHPVGAAVADMAYCGDPEVPRALLEQLITEVGFRPIDAGPLSVAPDLEGFARLVIRTATAVGRGPFTYRLARRGE
jgi:8-hydroxy-5-deazaflavin:NADPH oxidoreductase